MSKGKLGLGNKQLRPVIIQVMDVRGDQLKRAVEARYGCTARFIQAVPITQSFDGRTVWDGVVHIFRLRGNLICDIAYAWSGLTQDTQEERVFSYLHVPPVAGPRDAVRAAIIAERCG